MSYIAVNAPNSQPAIQISTATIATTSTGYSIPALQDITINNAAGVFNWQQLDRFSQLSVPTPATNSITANMVIDPETFFGTAGVVGATGVAPLFDLQNDATLVYFRVYMNGKLAGSKYISGQGYITNLAPTTNPGAPIFVSPITISVDGDLTASAV
jgi:hypothetical protein